jgi:hypothetical protein
MGCDIHIFAEVKKKGKWEKVSKSFKNPYYRPGEPNNVDDDGYEWNSEKSDSPYSGRNYDLFAILANVRNGHGFAGCDTGNGFIPISDPKGLPDDVSKEIKVESDGWGSDGHSHSHFTLSELLDYDWNQTTVHRGWVNEEQYEEFKKNGSPSSWCGMVNGGSIKKVRINEMEARLLKRRVVTEKVKRKAKPDEIQYYTQVQWDEKYSESAGSYGWEETIPQLKKFSKNHDNVRIVFWFDN